jgi:hypothetical protein
MLIGNRERFAVDWEIREINDHWVFGYFIFFINGTVIGDPADFSVDLKGCLGWIKDFLINARDRYEPGLYGMEKDDAYLLLASSVLAREDKQRSVQEAYQDTFARFHISHIGMSSFDRFTLLLVKDRNGEERCIWKMPSGEVMDAHLQPGEIESVFRELVSVMESSLARLPH